MRILLIHHSARVGGGTISGLDVAKILCKLGHEVIFAAPCHGEIVTSTCNSLNIKLDTVGVPPLYTYHNASTNGFKCLSKYIVSYINLNKVWRNYIKGVKPDLVILNSVTQAPLIGIINSLGIKSICTVRETYRERGSWFVNYILRQMVSKADAALYLTNYDKKQWATSNRINEVLPDVVDEERYIKHTNSEIQKFKLEENLDPNVNYILYLGGIAYAKGALDLLKAYDVVARKNKKIGLLLLGNPHTEKVSRLFRLMNHKELNYREECHSLIDDFINRDLPVKEVGLVPDTSYWYESSSVIVFPVKLVHQPRPAYEAGYYTKPIILPAYENFSEYLIDGTNGYLYDIDNAGSLAEKLLLSMSTKEINITLGQRNNDIYERTHSFSIGMNILDKILKTIFM